MEDALKSLSDAVREQAELLSQEIEPERKILTLRSFECMADCFRGPEPFEDCGKCAEGCNKPLEIFKTK